MPNASDRFSIRRFLRLLSPDDEPIATSRAEDLLARLSARAYLAKHMRGPGSEEESALPDDDK